MVKEIYRTIGIYRITNLVTGKSYIGQTRVDFGDRRDSHFSLLNTGKHYNKNMQADWDIYGAENFEFAVIEFVDNPNLLNDLEIQYVDIYTAKGLCYNQNPGGTGKGKHLTEEAKRKIGDKNKVNMTGRKPSEETRCKMSDSQKKRVFTDEEKQQIAERMRTVNIGKRRSDETKELLRKINQENPPSAKLTPDDVREIRRKSSEGVSTKDLSIEYKVSYVCICNIIHRRRWKHID